MELTPSFRVLLQHFRLVFTAPSFRLFVLIITGWALSSRHRFITECIFTAGQVGLGHWSCYHRFFSHYAWSLDGLCQVLAHVLIDHFAPHGPIQLAADDTLCRKRGLGLFGAGMHHDPLFSSKALKVFSWGHDWVVLAVLVRLPRWAPTKVFALPLLFRLYLNHQGLAKGKKANQTKKKRQRRGSGAAAPKKKKWRPVNPNHRTRPQLLVEMLQRLASWFPERQFVLCADSAYGGKSVLRHLPANVDLISQVHPQGVLYALPPPPTGKRGGPRKKGERLPGLQAWADDSASSWQQLVFIRPWYRRKREPSFQDMVTTLRRKSWEEKLAEVVSPSGPHTKWLATVTEWAARVAMTTGTIHAIYIAPKAKQALQAVLICWAWCHFSV
jgi:DDE superfamily endonuclease